MDTRKQPNRFLAILLSICMLLTMLPAGSITAFAAGDVDARSEEADVLIFSTYLASRTGNERYVKAARENIEAVLPALQHGVEMLWQTRQECAKTL